MSDLQTTSFADVIGKSECYLSNLSELAGELKEVAVELDGSIIKIDSYQDVVIILQVLWDKFKETAKECEGKDIEVKLPSGLTGVILQAAMAAVGFKL